MRKIAALILAGTLAACGADGEPEPPAPKPETGIKVSGTARVGVSISTSGMHGNGAVTVTRGPVTVGLGF